MCLCNCKINSPTLLGGNFGPEKKYLVPPQKNSPSRPLDPRGWELKPNIFFSNFWGASGISRQNPGISRQKSLIPWVSRNIPNFLAPTPSRGRPPPHQKISGLNSLGLGSFFVPLDPPPPAPEDPPPPSGDFQKKKRKPSPPFPPGTSDSPKQKK